MQYICQYGNCDDAVCPIVITINPSKERARFCSHAHAIAWLYERVEKQYGSGRLAPAKESALLAECGITRLK